MAEEVKTEEVKPEETKTENGKQETEAKPIEVTEELKNRILRQIEYYFGDINLPRDRFLREQVTLDDGWVPISTLLTFNRLKKICADADIIGQTIGEATSDLLEWNEEQKKVRRKPDLAIPEFNDERKLELQQRTAYVKGFPSTMTLEELQKYFEQFGKNDAIHMRHYIDRAAKKPVFKGSIFVIFKDVDTCKKFLDMEEVKFEESVLIRKWQSVYLQEKKLEREERDLIKLTKKNKNKNKKENKEDEKEITWPKGAILHLEGFTNENTPREDIKTKITEINSTEPAYITYNKGEKEAFIRFSEENEAIEFLKKVPEKKLEIDGNELTLEVLEGEKEEKFLTELTATIGKIRQQHRFRGRKRKFGGHDGPRSKQQKNE